MTRKPGKLKSEDTLVYRRSDQPGFNKPTKGLRNGYKIAVLLGLVYPVMRWASRRHVRTLEELGRALLQAATVSSSKRVLECVDIVELARGASIAGDAA